MNSCFDLLMHIDVSDIFTGIQKVSLLYLAQFSRLTFEIKSVTPNFVASLVFLCHYIHFFFRYIDKARGSHFEN